MTTVPALLLTTSILASWPLAARAQAPAPGAVDKSAAANAPRILEYKRLDPAIPNAALSAKPLTDACIEINANFDKLAHAFKDKCAACPKVSGFCKNPLVFAEVPDPAAAHQIANATCP